MKGAINAFLNTPIPLKTALIGLAFNTGTHMITHLANRQIIHEQVETIERQNRALQILTEASELLMEQASPQTISELSEKLEFWRIIVESNK